MNSQPHQEIIRTTLIFIPTGFLQAKTRECGVEVLRASFPTATASDPIFCKKRMLLLIVPQYNSKRKPSRRCRRPRRMDFLLYSQGFRNIQSISIIVYCGRGRECVCVCVWSLAKEMGKRFSQWVLTLVCGKSERRRKVESRSNNFTCIIGKFIYMIEWARMPSFNTCELCNGSCYCHRGKNTCINQPHSWLYLSR